MCFTFGTGTDRRGPDEETERHEMFNTGTTVIVEEDLATMGQTTSKGTVARILPKGQRGLMEGVPGWTGIETFDGKRWVVQEKDLSKAPRPWGWYQEVHPYAAE